MNIFQNIISLYYIALRKLYAGSQDNYLCTIDDVENNLYVGGSVPI